MTVGVLGGTFDPPHIGHLRAAIEAREALELDRVLLVVANVPWQKAGTRPITPAAVRLAMVEAAVDGLAGLAASDVEIRRGGPSYTVDTLRALRALEPAEDLVVLIGADLVEALPTWQSATALPGLARLAVLDRPGPSSSSVATDVDVGSGVSWSAVRVPIPPLDVSSSDIRDRCRRGRSVELLVPEGVATIIASHGIYRGEMTGAAE